MVVLNRKRNILFGTLLGYFSIALNIVAGLVFTPWIIIHFGKSGYGVYSLASSLVSMLLIDLGLTNAINTFLSKYRAEKDTQNIQKALTIVYRIYLILDAILIVVFSCLYFCSPLLYRGLSADEMSVFKVCFIIFASFSLLTFPCTTFNGVLNSHEKFVFMKSMDIIQRIVFILLTTIVIVCNLGIYFLVIANCLSSLLVCLGKYLFIRFRLKIYCSLKTKITKKELKSFLFFTSWAALISICSRIAFNFVPTILGIMTDSSSIALFNICSTIEGFIYSICTVAGTFFLPKIAELKQDNKSFSSNFNKLVKRVGKFQFLIISLIFTGFVVVGRDFIILWMRGDSSYLPVYFGIIILVIYQLIDAPQIVLRSALYLTPGGVKKYAIAESITAVLNVAMCVLLVSLANKFSFEPALGACLSILLSRLINLLMKNIIYSKMLPLSIVQFWKDVYLKNIIYLFGVVIIGLRINELLVNTDVLVRFLVSGTTVSLLYILISYLFILEKDDKKLLFHIKKRV